MTAAAAPGAGRERLGWFVFLLLGLTFAGIGISAVGALACLATGVQPPAALMAAMAIGLTALSLASWVLRRRASAARRDGERA